MWMTVLAWSGHVKMVVKQWTRASRVSVSVQPDTPENIAKQVRDWRHIVFFLLAFLLANRQILNETCSKFAEINECESAPCLNGGVCTDRVNRFEFSCAAAWSAHTRGLNVYTLTCVSHVDVAPGNIESYRIQFYRLTYMSGALCF